MQNQTVQLRVTLPSQLQAYLQTKADRFGLNMSSYVKNLIIDDIKNDAYPTYQASQSVEDAYQEAKQLEKQGKLIGTDDVKNLLNNL